MSLEARIELLTAAVIELTVAIGAMQAPGPLEGEDLPQRKPVVVIESYGPGGGTAVAGATGSGGSLPNAQPSSSDTTSGKPSAPTGESSLPALDYVKDVKPLTIRLSKEKGREITIEVLSCFGVKSAQDLDAAQWGEYIAHCEKVLAGGEV